MANMRTKELIVEFLESRKTATTDEIKTFLNKRTRHGVTMQQLGNLVAKHPLIEKIDYVDISSHTGRYKQCVWKLKD